MPSVPRFTRAERASRVLLSSTCSRVARSLLSLSCRSREDLGLATTPLVAELITRLDAMLDGIEPSALLVAVFIFRAGKGGRDDEALLVLKPEEESLEGNCTAACC